MKCPSCAATIGALDRVCQYCGTEIPATVSPSVASVANEQPPSAPSAASLVEKLQEDLAALAQRPFASRTRTILVGLLTPPTLGLAFIVDTAIRVFSRQGESASRLVLSIDEGIRKIRTAYKHNPDLMTQAKKAETELAGHHAARHSARMAFLVSAAASLALIIIVLLVGAWRASREVDRKADNLRTTIAKVSTGDLPAALDLLTKLSDAERREIARSDEFAAVALQLLKGQDAEAMETAKRIPDAAARAKALNYISPRLIEAAVNAKDFPAALNAAAMLSPESLRKSTEDSIRSQQAKHLVETDRLGEAKQVVARIDNAEMRAQPVALVKEMEDARKTGKPVEPVVAIFIANRIGTIGDGELRALEDYITGRITEINVRVISSETALHAVSGMIPGAKANALDSQLTDSTSAVRLAEALGATHLLQVTITGFDSNRKTIDAYGVKTINDERTARVTYKILDGGNGASMAADTVSVTKMVQQSNGLSDQRSDMLNGMLAEAGAKVAESLKRQIDRGKITGSTKADMATVSFTTELADIYIPDVRIGDENAISIASSRFKVSVLAATIEVDGMAVGTIPGKIDTRSGLHKVRVVREGYKPWERFVNCKEGQKLNVALEMTDAGFARWLEATAFINALKNGARLTDGEVTVLQGKAKLLEQSGFKVDTKEGVHVTNKSLF